MDNYNIEYYRSKAKCLLTQINDGREFLSHHKPSLGFGENIYFVVFYVRICLMMSK